MKQIFFLLISSALFCSSLPAQTVRQMRKVTELRMPSGPGDNGGTVALNLKNRFYYATIAGNKTYSMAFFNGSGEMVSPPDLALMADIRGLWYSPVTKTFHANAHGTTGWITYVIDDAGIPYDVKTMFAGQRQPFPQSTGSFNQRENVVYFLKGSSIIVYDAATGNEVPEKMKVLKTGYTVKNPAPADWKVDTFQVLTDYNSTTVVFTGQGNAEFGLLNIKTKAVELYSSATGLLTQRLQLPPEAPVKDKLNFAFANNIYWIYDKGTRSWLGYR